MDPVSLEPRSDDAASRRTSTPAVKVRTRRGKDGTNGAIQSACPELKLQVNLPNGSRLGPGKIKLLEMINQEGSLSRGAAKMGISYRRAWLFMQQVNDAFSLPAIATPEGGHGGGSAKLTKFGQQLIERYRQMEKAADAAAAETLQWLNTHK